MNVKVVSVKKVVNKEGNTMYQVFALAPDNSIGNFWCQKELKAGDTVELSIGTNKECKFVVRPVING